MGAGTNELLQMNTIFDISLKAIANCQFSAYEV
jgi:hypothetical protein